MENEGGVFEQPKFASPEEELQYLRERVAAHEQESWKKEEPAQKDQIISETITQYAQAEPSAHLEQKLIIENPQFEKVVATIDTLPHQEKMRELYHLLAEKGVLSAIKVTRALNNPHIENDFHRVLVEYVRTGGIVPGLEKERDLARDLGTILYEITVPFSGTQDKDKPIVFREVIVAMERFFQGMIPLSGGNVSNYGPFTLEIVLANFSNDIVFYVGIPTHMEDLFIKQLLGSFPVAKLEQVAAEHNIFNEFGTTVASYAVHTNKFVYPISFPDEQSEQDPLTVILNAFTRVERDGEGAAIQFVVYPDTDNLGGKVKHGMGQIRKGISIGRATDIPLFFGGAVVKGFSEFFASGQKKENEPDKRAQEFSEKVAQMMEEKISSPLLRTNMRIVASAPTRERAEMIRTSIEAAFTQFARAQGNAIKWNHVEKSRLEELNHNFTYRKVDTNETMVFNTKELATLYHLPLAVSQKDVPQLKAVKAASAPAPADLPSEGTLIGVNKYRGETHEIRMQKLDRLRHLYVIGQTGTGKSVFLTNLVMQDIFAGNGVCFIDPHGSDVQNVLAAIPKDRIEDVIYFDPSYTDRPFALNMLEYDVNHPEQKIFVVNEMLAIFKKLYSASPESMGPAFEQYFRNATMLVMEDPETGNTLLEIPRVLADANFRNLKLSRCKNPIVVQFWRDIATKSTGEAGLQNMVPYITNKFDVFLSNDVMRPIIAQEKSSFNFRDIMDNKKILLVNLAKGKLGEMNANLIGLILIGKFLMAAMSRVDSFGKSLPDFYLYVDEFQNVATPSIASILSEARKYGLSLNIAHQYIEQLPEDIKGAVFGNVGNMAVFRVGTEDAQFLESQFAPTFNASDIMKIENRNAYVKMLIGGKPVPPFNIETLPPPPGSPEIVEQLKQLSYLKFGKDRKLVDEAIMKKYLPQTPPPSLSVPPPTPTLRQVTPTAGAVPPPGTPFGNAFTQAGVTASSQQVSQ